MRIVSTRVRIGVTVAFVCCLALVLSGCPGPTFVAQQYTGPQRDNDSIAILRVNASEYPLHEAPSYR